jgi:hypothetical protein
MQIQWKFDTWPSRVMKVAALTLFVGLGISSALHPADQIYPLKVSANKRYLVDQKNTPFLVQGDSPWSLIVAADDAGVEQYLENRREKGFNAIIVNMLEHHFCPHPPLNLAGDGPFTTPGDFSTPNEKYFAHADWVIRKAAEYGMLVVIYPFTVGYVGTDEGWVEEMLANGPEKCHNFGRYLGKRYNDFDNIAWILAGDRHPTVAIQEDIDMLALGIRDYDQRHLMSAHCEPEHSAVEDWSSGGWLDFNTTYTYEVVHVKLLQDYNRTPIIPYILVESSYEGEHNASEVQIRRQAYWGVLCGGFGHFFGNNPIWHFGGQGYPQFPSKVTWQQAMDLPGSVGMQHWGELFHSRNWYDLIPDQKHEVVTSGLGEFTGLDYLAAARTSDGSTVIAYMPTCRTVSVDTSKVAGSQVKAWWFDPKSGKAADAGTFLARGTREFTPPKEGDWVLVLDDAARQLPPPGAAR